MFKRNSIRWLERGLLVLGLVLTGWVLRSRGEALAFQAEESSRLDRMLTGRDTTLTGAARLPKPAQSPAESVKRVIGRIEIPRLKISAMIAEGTEHDVLEMAVGHLSRTAQPGEPGNVALAGHRDSFFRGLGDIRENDLIRIVTPGGTYSYQVKWGRVFEPKRVDVLDATDACELTLITCYPFHFVGKAPQRFIVRAEQIDPVARNGSAHSESRPVRTAALR